jgi:hypothetical protein
MESEARWLWFSTQRTRRSIYRGGLPVDIPYVPMGNSLVPCPALGETTVCLCCICPGSLQVLHDCHCWDDYGLHRQT